VFDVVTGEDFIPFPEKRFGNIGRREKVRFGVIAIQAQVFHWKQTTTMAEKRIGDHCRLGGDGKIEVIEYFAVRGALSKDARDRYVASLELHNSVVFI
jgi:hypothetical protein